MDDGPLQELRQFDAGGRIGGEGDSVADHVDGDAAHEVCDLCRLRIEPGVECRELTLQSLLALRDVLDLEAGLLGGLAGSILVATVSESDDALAEVVEPHAGKRVGKLDARDGGELCELLREFGTRDELVGRQRQVVL